MSEGMTRQGDPISAGLLAASVHLSLTTTLRFVAARRADVLLHCSNSSTNDEETTTTPSTANHQRDPPRNTRPRPICTPAGQTNRHFLTHAGTLAKACVGLDDDAAR